VDLESITDSESAWNPDPRTESGSKKKKEIKNFLVFFHFYNWQVRNSTNYIPKFFPK
jgi:hypothetical protein